VSDILHEMVARYGLLAVFLGSLAEGETAAILAGFFSHQKVFVAWQAFLVAFTGAFLGDTLLYFVGRRYALHPWVLRLKRKPGFRHAHRLVRRYPNSFVFFNRYAYGMRMIGGITAGLSGIRMLRFILLNALSALVWAILFGGLGYVFGVGAERLLGQTMVEHQRLLFALAGGVAAGGLAWYAAHHFFHNDNGKDVQEESPSAGADSRASPTAPPDARPTRSPTPRPPAPRQ
jgi:membrane protein DedA with SNARE-associated domain